MDTVSKVNGKQGKARSVKASDGKQMPPVEGLSISFTVSQSLQQVFDAINDVRGWWSGEIEGRTDELGAEFTYRYKDVHRSTQKITELVPGKRVVWHVTDAFLSFVDDKTEWNGTDIEFDIARRGDKTEVCFTHFGLVPKCECYDGCSGAWGFYIKESLRNLITIGRGAPNEKES
ncbi:MAG: SRPBCC family protein [Myxococcales bacterium]